MTSTPRAHYEAQKLFDRIADDYRERSETRVYNVSSLSFRRRQDIVTALLRTTPKGGTILDYGMGPAVFGPPSVGHDLRYIGIDIAPRMIELARALDLPNAEYYQGDLEILPRFEHGADTVLLVGLIDYLADPMEGLQQLARCVRPSGRLILSFRNHRSIPRWLRNTSRELWSALRGSTRGNETAFEAPVLENSFVPQRDLIPLLAQAGFTRFDIRYLDCSPIFFNMPLPKPLWVLARKVDAAISCAALSWMCASGTIMAYGKR